MLFQKLNKLNSMKKSTAAILAVLLATACIADVYQTRQAEIAFINEYGKQGQPARPFIGTAMNRSADRIQDQAEKVIGDWIENEFQR